MERIVITSLGLLLAVLLSAATTQCDLLIHFDKDKSTLTSKAIAELDGFIASLAINGDYAFTVHGHTDSDGSQGYNEELAQARAQAVLAYLVQRGVDPALATIAASGERDPLAPNRDETGMALNRRVRLTFVRYTFADVEELRQELMEGSVHRYTIDPRKDQVIIGPAGVQVQVPANALVGANGRPLTGEVQIELTEALALQAMLAHQLSTRSGDRLLETAGMARIEAFDANGVPLDLAPGGSMSVSVPVGSKEDGMELFTSTDGADWTRTERSLTNTTVRTWVEPRFPMPPQYWFNAPRYREDQRGKPIKPVEPLAPRRPSEPQRERYMSAKPWWAFLAPERAAVRCEADYQAALSQYRVKLAKYDVKQARYEEECAAYPAALEKYIPRKAEWDARKREEYRTWIDNVLTPARERFDAAVAPERARYDSLVANWRQVREASMREYVLRADSLNAADINGVSAYVFTTTQLGWINCDRFYGTPGTRPIEVIAKDRLPGGEQVFLIFSEIRSMLGMTRDGRTYVSPPVPRDQALTLFAYAVIDGRAHVCVQPVEPGKRPDLKFEPSSIAEIGKLMKELSGVKG